MECIAAECYVYYTHATHGPISPMAVPDYPGRTVELRCESVEACYAKVCSLREGREGWVRVRNHGQVNSDGGCVFFHPPSLDSIFAYRRRQGDEYAWDDVGRWSCLESDVYIKNLLYAQLRIKHALITKQLVEFKRAHLALQLFLR